MLPFTVHPVGDSALLAVFTQRIAPEIGAAVAALNTRVLSANISGVDETVPRPHTFRERAGQRRCTNRGRNFVRSKR